MRLKQTKVGEIPEGWKQASLGGISSDISYGYTASASDIPVGPKFLRITDIQGNYVDWHSVPYCQISEEDTKKYQLDSGDICIARTGASTGTNYTVKDKEDAVFASYLIRYRIDRSVAEPFYIGFLLKSSKWKDFVASIIGGSAQPGANAKQFASFEFILPLLLEQRAIAKILSDLDEKIKLNNQMNKTLESICQAIFKRWFVDFEPWGGEQPDDWQSYTLGDISVLSAGGDRPKVYSEKLSITCTIPIYSNGIDNDGLYGYTNSAKIIEESVTVSARGTIGFTCLRQVPYFPIVRLISLVPNQRYLSAKYLYLWLKNINISGTGTTQQQLTVPDFKKTEILIPTPEIMKRFTIVADSIFAQITANKNENTSITAIRDSLLPRLMSGKIRVV